MYRKRMASYLYEAIFFYIFKYNGTECMQIKAPSRGGGITMKGITLSAGILAASLAINTYAAECSFERPSSGAESYEASFYYPTTALYLFENDYLDLSKMDKREPAVKNLSGTDSVWAYRSELDTTLVVIVSEKVVKVSRVPYTNEIQALVDTLFSVHHDAVFKDEFPRLQKAGVFKGTAEAADSLVNHVFELCQTLYCPELGYTSCEFNPPYARRRNEGKDVDVADGPLALSAIAGVHAIILDTINFCPEYRIPAAVIDPPQALMQTATKASVSKMSSGHYRINNVKQGTPYRVFSVNGQLLEKGTLESGMFVAPTLPVILMLNDNRALYLKD